MNNKESLIVRFLKRIGLIKSYSISKADMCKEGQSICDKDCERCVWNEVTE